MCSVFFQAAKTCIVTCARVQVLLDDDVVDLTAVPHRPAPRASTTANTFDEVSVLATDLSPAAKRRNIEVAKALEAHRLKGQQVYAKAFKQPTPEPKEVETKPRCGICLEEMKEPACGSCG